MDLTLISLTYARFILLIVDSRIIVSTDLATDVTGRVLLLFDLLVPVLLEGAGVLRRCNRQQIVSHESVPTKLQY